MPRGSGSKSSSSGGGNSSGGGAAPAAPAPQIQIVSGWEYHGYSNGTSGDSSRYAYVGKDDGGTPEFIDYGRNRK